MTFYHSKCELIWYSDPNCNSMFVLLYQFYVVSNKDFIIHNHIMNTFDPDTSDTNISKFTSLVSLIEFVPGLLCALYPQ